MAVSRLELISILASSLRSLDHVDSRVYEFARSRMQGASQRDRSVRSMVIENLNYWFFGLSVPIWIRKAAHERLAIEYYMKFQVS